MKLILPRLSLITAVERLGPIVPHKPLDPAFGQLRFVVDGELVVIDATDGEIRARVVVPCEAGSEGMDLLPAGKLGEIAKLIGPGDAPVEIDTTERSRAVVQVGATRFTFPLHASEFFPTFPAIPEVDAKPAIFNTDELVGAIQRVSYAMGGPGAKPEARMVAIDGGKATAYSGRRIQEAVLESHAEVFPVLVRDEALLPLARFLRISGQVGVTAVFSVEHAVTEGDDRTVEFFMFALNDGYFAIPKPASPFIDLTRTWQIADQQREASGVLEVGRDDFLNAIAYARVQADPKDPRLVLDLNKDSDTVRVSARIDDRNEFETFLPAEYSGKEKPRSVAMSLDDAKAMVEAYPDATLSLLIAPAKFSDGRSRPLVQLVDGNARAVISQTEAP